MTASNTHAISTGRSMHAQVHCNSLENPHTSCQAPPRPSGWANSRKRSRALQRESAFPWSWPTGRPPCAAEGWAGSRRRKRMRGNALSLGRPLGRPAALAHSASEGLKPPHSEDRSRQRVCLSSSGARSPYLQRDRRSKQIDRCRERKGFLQLGKFTLPSRCESRNPGAAGIPCVE